MDLACHHLDTIRQERRQGRPVKRWSDRRHDLDKCRRDTIWQKTRQANLDAACWGVRATTRHYYGCSSRWWCMHCSRHFQCSGPIHGTVWWNDCHRRILKLLSLDIMCIIWWHALGSSCTTSLKRILSWVILSSCFQISPDCVMSSLRSHRQMFLVSPLSLALRVPRHGLSRSVAVWFSKCAAITSLECLSLLELGLFSPRDPLSIHCIPNIINLAYICDDMISFNISAKLTGYYIAPCYYHVVSFIGCSSVLWTAYSNASPTTPKEENTTDQLRENLANISADRSSCGRSWRSATRSRGSLELSASVSSADFNCCAVAWNSPNAVFSAQCAHCEQQCACAS